MYDQFYGLQGRPFQLTPDPTYYFESATHRKALSYLGYGLAQGEGFIVITGDIGAGKTTLVGHLMQTIDPARLTAVKIVSTQVEGDDMLRLAAQSFGLPSEGHSKAATLQQIEGFLHRQARAGRRTLLIVDEAQNLPVSAIEELRMLSNFQLGGQSLLQIFLLGQPEFRDLLKAPELEQLRQRVIATHHLDPMMAQEVEPYILHRLTVAGWAGNPIFTQDAFAALYAATNGVPRRLNALVSRVLLLGAIEALPVIDAEVVAAVVADMGLDVDLAPAAPAASALDAIEGEIEEDVEEPAEDMEAEETAPAPSNVVTPLFQRPAFVAPSWAQEADDEEEIDWAATEAEPALVADDETVHVAVSPEPENSASAVHIAVSPDADEDADPLLDVAASAEVDAVRSDLLAEIAALRAEVAALRETPAPVAQAEIDPEALKGCFTLIEERLSSLEFRAEEQDAALRRVLTLLVDWVEQDDQQAGAQAVA